MAFYVCKQCGAESLSWTGACATCGSKEHVALLGQTSREGQTVAGRYKLIKRLGEGGMGAVYLAEQVGVGNQLALKFLKPELSHNETIARRFLAEARTTIRVAHPGAVQLTDYGQDETGALYLVMELVDGVDVRRLLDERRRLAPKEAVQIALAVADVLEHAHSKGVVHRDLKPENVMVRPGLGGFHVKVLDFGIAHLAYAGADRLTQTGALAGTPKYMAPEQVRAETVDARTDVYALGLMLFEMLTGRSAFDGPSVSEILHQQATQPVPALGAVDAQLINAGLDLVVSKATQKKKEDRFQTMAEFARALSALTPDQLVAHALDAPPPGRVVPAQETAETYVSSARKAMATPAVIVPAPVAVVVAPRRTSQAALAVSLLTLALVGLVGWYLAHRTPESLLPVPTGCPQLTLYDPKWRAMSVSELEEHVAHVPYMRPSDARNQIQTLKNTMGVYAEDQRECLYRSSLISMAANVDAVMKSSASLWGLRVSSDTLKQQFLELPLTKNWSLDQRKDVLAQIDSNVLPHLEVKIPEDTEYWRRMYYGLLLTCEATDATLEQLRTQRPGNCANWLPRDTSNTTP